MNEADTKVEDIYLKSLAKDLGCFKQIALDFLKAEIIQGVDARLSKKYHVSILKCYKGTPSNKDIFYSLEYFSPALSAYACFTASKNSKDKNDCQIYFGAGVEFSSEWSDRKKSVEYYLAFMRTNTDPEEQYKIILQYFKNKNVTGYAINKADIANKKTAEKVLKKLKTGLG